MYFAVKRIIDFVLSLITLIMLAPLFIIVAIAIKIDSKGPVIFKQKRVGIHKTHFTMYKFRTMRTDTPKDMATHLLDNSNQYISRVGSVLRKPSIDELLQFFHSLVGTMSVGDLKGINLESLCL